MSHQHIPLNYTKLSDCDFCRTIRPERLMSLCSQCQMMSYCSKKCQRNDWQSHKQYCEHTSCAKKKNMDKYEEIADKFITDHRDGISAKLVETISETGHKMNELVLELDFDTDEFGLVPALSNPPQFEINALQTHFPDDLEEEPDIIRDLKENDMSVIWRFKSVTF